MTTRVLQTSKPFWTGQLSGAGPLGRRWNIASIRIKRSEVEMHAGEALGRATANPTVLSSARGQVPRRCCSAASEARGGCASPSSFSGLSSRGARPRSFSLPESFGKVGQQRRRSKQAFSGCIAGVGPEEHVAGWTLSELDYPRGLVRP